MVSLKVLQQTTCINHIFVDYEVVTAGTPGLLYTKRGNRCPKTVAEFPAR